MKFFLRSSAPAEITKKASRPERKLGMSFSIIMYIGLRNLTLSKARSFLTIGGVALGIGIVTFLLCMGFGVQKLIVNEVTKNNPLDVIDVNNGNLDNFVSLDNEHLKNILAIEGVKEVERRINVGGKVAVGESQTDAVIFGANPGYFDLARIAYKAKGGVYAVSENKAVISDKLANLLGYEDPMSIIGQKILYNVVVTKDISSRFSEEKVFENNETEIVGVIDRAESAFLYLPFDVVQSSFELDLAQSGKILITEVERFGSVQTQLEQMGFVTESINDLIKDINSFFDTMRIVLVIFGIIIMSISVMGILNTLSISLLQRTKEIGILKALGTKRSDVFKMFVIESIIISFLGGVTGFIGGYLVAYAVNYVLIALGQRSGVDLTFFVYMPWSFIAAVGAFIIFIGIATGLMPAMRAAKIHALEALRYE